jgi:hypothetical protein
LELPLQTLFRAPVLGQFAAALLENAANPLAVEKTARLLVSLSQLSDAEVRQMLSRTAAAVEKGVSS